MGKKSPPFVSIPEWGKGKEAGSALGSLRRTLLIFETGSFVEISFLMPNSCLNQPKTPYPLLIYLLTHHLTL